MQQEQHLKNQSSTQKISAAIGLILLGLSKNAN